MAERLLRLIVFASARVRFRAPGHMDEKEEPARPRQRAWSFSSTSVPTDLRGGPGFTKTHFPKKTSARPCVRPSWNPMNFDRPTSPRRKWRVRRNICESLSDCLRVDFGRRKAGGAKKTLPPVTKCKINLLKCKMKMWLSPNCTFWRKNGYSREKSRRNNHFFFKKYNLKTTAFSFYTLIN